jgi:hypothetical protein
MRSLLKRIERDDVREQKQVREEEHMSSVHAVTENICFGARVASFYPIDYAKLSREFHEWLAAKQSDYHIIVYRTEVNYKENT